MAKKAKQYQQKFITLEEAISDARKQSKTLGIKLYIIQSRRLFFVDSNGTIRDNETLHSTFTDGKKSKG